MAKKWGCRAYYNPNPFISVSWHETLLPIPLPPFVLPTVAPHLNFSVVQGLWIGSFLSNGRHKTIRGDNLFFMGRMSDAGLFIPHISFPPSWMNILTTLFASSNALFGTSSVTLACKNALWGNQDCDLALTPFGPAPLSVNVACHEYISLPTDIVIVWGSVYAGMSLGDFLAALVDFAIGLVTEVFTKYVGTPLAKKVGTKALESSAGKAIMAGGAKVFKAIGKAGSKVAAKFSGKKAVDELMDEAKEKAGKSFGDKFSSAMKQLFGQKITTSAKKYSQKAAKVKGIQKSIKTLCKKEGKNFDDELAELVNIGKGGHFSKEFLEQLKATNSKKYDDYLDTNKSRFKGSLERAENASYDKELVQADGKPMLTRQHAVEPDMTQSDANLIESMGETATHRRQGAVDLSSETDLADEFGTPMGHRRQDAVDFDSAPDDQFASAHRRQSTSEFDSEFDDFADDLGPGHRRQSTIDFDSEFDDFADELGPVHRGSMDFETELREFGTATRHRRQRALGNFNDVIDDVPMPKQTHDPNIVANRMRGEFLDALKEMNDAAVRATSKETMRVMGYSGLKSLFSTLLWKHIIRNGNLIRVNVKIGKFTYKYQTRPSVRLADKFFTGGAVRGGWSKLGLQTSGSAYWDDSNDPTAPEQSHDYWYGGSQNSASAPSADYWYRRLPNTRGRP